MFVEFLFRFSGSTGQSGMMIYFQKLLLSAEVWCLVSIKFSSLYLKLDRNEMPISLQKIWFWSFVYNLEIPDQTLKFYFRPNILHCAFIYIAWQVVWIFWNSYSWVSLVELWIIIWRIQKIFSVWSWPCLMWRHVIRIMYRKCLNMTPLLLVFLIDLPKTFPTNNLSLSCTYY